MNLDPNALSGPSWSARLAALKSRAAPDDDPRVAECRRALAFWRVKRAVDAERDLLGEDGVVATTELLLDIVAAAS